jgi:hypothetical protein
MTTSAPLSTFRTIAHLVRHDLHRFRALIVASIGLELLRAIVVEWMLHRAPIAIGDRFGGAGGELERALLDLLLRAATWITTAVVVQADHPSDDRAFWRTRPLAPHAVALAKLALLALIFAAVPALINGARLAAYGAPVAAHVAATVQIVLSAGSSVVLAWTLAILARTLPRFLAGIAGLIIGAYLLFMATLWYFGLAGGGIGSMHVGVGMESAGSESGLHGWILGTALVGLGLSILVAHYRVRRTWAALAAGITLFVALPQLFPPPPHAAAPPPDLARLLDRPLRPESVTLQGPFPSDPRQQGILSGALALPGLPRDVSAGVFVDQVRVEVDGRDVAIDGIEQCCLGAGPIGVASTLPVPPSPPIDGGSVTDGLARVTGIAVSALRTQPVTVDARARVVFVRHRLAASLRLAPGAAFRGDGYMVEVLAVGDRFPAVLLRLTRFPHLGAEGAPHLSFFDADAARTRVREASSPVQGLARPSREPAYEWAHGRHWAMRAHTIILRRDDIALGDRLLIVESHRAGEAPARIAWTGLPADRP